MRTKVTVYKEVIQKIDTRKVQGDRYSEWVSSPEN